MDFPSDRKTIYLDYAATAPLCEAAKRAMDALLEEPDAGLFDGAANANALHGAGRRAFQRLEEARSRIADALGAQRPSEIVFTGSATEADNAAILGLAIAARELRSSRDGKANVVLSALEHDAVRATADGLRALGFAVREVRPDGDGFIEARALESVIDEGTLLVSVQMANSEIGSVQPVRVLAELAHERGALFHTDGVQALGKIPIDLARLGCDAATFSSHKIAGPSGVAALYLRHGTPFRPLLVGGGQEAGRRSGTQNVVGAVGFAAAVEAAVSAREWESQRLMTLRDRLYGALAVLPSVEATVDVAPGSLDYLPSLAAFLVDGFESETLVLRYDELGFAVSGGSACASASLEPSYALRAIGIPGDRALGALRITMGSATTAEDIEAFIAVTPRVLSWSGA